MNNILEKGELINETYTVKFFIGSGAFGEVYRVNHKYLGTQVLKVIIKEIYSEKDVESVISESLILSKLTHQNIVRVFDANIFIKNSRKYHFIAAEFVSGESLQQLLHRKIKLNLEKAINIQKDILIGLKVAHSHNPPIIHRDIKPANILLSYEDNIVAKLSDFGLATKIDRRYPIANAGGTLPYLADECFYGVYTQASDVFSAGITFYQMLTGMFPWEYKLNAQYNNHEEMATMILAARKNKPTPPSCFNSGCTKKVDNIILKALERDLEHRYKNANEFYDDFITFFNS